LFTFGWFIAGNVWVYGIYSRVAYDDLIPDTYCSQVCYLFSFWAITLTWIFAALLCLCMCGVIVLAVGVGGVAACLGGKK
jgi:hypothetical protein